MTFLTGKTRITVSFYSLAVFALFLFTDKTGTVTMFFAAVGLHEAGHLLWLWYSGGTVTQVSVTLASLSVTARTKRQTLGAVLMLNLSGCALNALLAAVLGLCFHSAFTIRFSAVNAAVCAVNLVPIEGLDGGTVCKALLTRWLGLTAGERVFSWVSAAATVAAALTVVYTIIDKQLYIWGAAALVAVLLPVVLGKVE